MLLNESVYHKKMKRLDNIQLAIEFSRKKLIPYSIGIFPKFRAANHHRLIAEKLERIKDGTLKKLIITMPPRHGKTLLATKIFPSWYLGHFSDKSVIITSYGADLSKEFGRYVRNTIQTPFFETVFPTVSIAEDSFAQTRFHLNSGGSLIAVGRGGAITGKGGNLIVIDDIFKNRQDAESSAARELVWSWYTSTLRTRLDPNGAIVIINTRWHQDDLIGRLLENQSPEEPWDVLNLPAINDKNEALWPEVIPIETLQAIKRDIGTYDFEALYQQNPTSREGSIIKREWFKFYKEMPSRFQFMLLSWDLSFKDSKDSDFVVGQCWGVSDSRIYLVDQVRAKMDFVTTKNTFRMFSQKHPQAFVKLVEDKANGPAILSELRSSVMGLKPINPKDSKQARLMSVSPMFEAGNVYLPDPTIAPWIHDFTQELSGFPSMKHDDQVDAMSQALNEIKVYSTNYIKKLVTL